MKTHAWKLLHNQMLTSVELELRGALPDGATTLCPLCKTEQETVSYIFFECSRSQELWSKCLRWLGVQTPLLNKAKGCLLQFYGLFGNNIRNHLAVGIWVCTTWLIWKTRNSIVFEEGNWSTNTILAVVQSQTWSCYRWRKKAGAAFAATDHHGNSLA